MERAFAAKHLMCVGLMQSILVGWFAASGLCCLEDVHPGNCSCQPFGRTRIIVKCEGIKQVPRDLPSNTAVLDLSGNKLSSIQEDAFRNVTLLGSIDLSSNSLRSIPRNLFRNLTLLKIINLGKNSIKGGFYLPKSAAKLKIDDNRLSLDDLKVILKESKLISVLNITGNLIGPDLTSDTFAGFDKMRYLYMVRCGLKHIESGSFRAMKKLEHLDLPHNMLSHIEPGTFEGPSDKFLNLFLSYNDLTTIADGTFRRFTKLNDLRLSFNRLTSVPDLTGVPEGMENLEFEGNQIKNMSQLGNSKIKRVVKLSLDGNQMEHLPVNIFQDISIEFSLELSFNKLKSIPDLAFSGCKNLTQLQLRPT